MLHDEANEPTHVVPPHGTNDPNVDAHDTPTQRATINQLHVDELDAWLEQIRERRLQKVKQLETIAKIKSDEVRLSAFLRFEKTYKTTQRALQRLDEQEKKVEAMLHKCRLLAMAALLEVGEEEESVDADD